MFDRNGNFAGIKVQDPGPNSERPTRYGHGEISDSEFQKMSEMIAAEINKEFKEGVPSANNKKEYVVDGLTGATRIAQREVTPIGAAYTTQAIFKYAKNSISQI